MRHDPNGIHLYITCMFIYMNDTFLLYHKQHTSRMDPVEFAESGKIHVCFRNEVMVSDRNTYTPWR